MASPGGAVILSLRTARSVYAGGGVEGEGRRLRRSSCELEEEEGEGKEEEGAYAGGWVIVAIFYFCVGQRVLGRVGSRGAVMRGMKHDEKYIYASVKKNEVQQYRVVRYGVLYVVGDRALVVEEPSRKEDKVASFCGGAFMAQFGKPGPFSIPQMESASLSASRPSKAKRNPGWGTA